MRREVQKEATAMGVTLEYLRNLPEDHLEQREDESRGGGGDGGGDSRGRSAVSLPGRLDGDARMPTWNKPATSNATGRFRPPSEDPWDFKMCRRTLGRQSDQHVTFSATNGVARRFEIRQGRPGIDTVILARKPWAHVTESGGAPREDWCHVAELSARTGVPRRKLMLDLRAFEAKSGPDRSLQV